MRYSRKLSVREAVVYGAAVVIIYSALMSSPAGIVILAAILGTLGACVLVAIGGSRTGR